MDAFIFVLVSVIFILGVAIGFYIRVYPMLSTKKKRNELTQNSQTAQNVAPIIKQIMSEIEPIRQEYYSKCRLYFINILIFTIGSIFALVFVFLIFGEDIVGKPTFWIIIIVILLSVLLIANGVYNEKYLTIKNKYYMRYKNTNIIPRAINLYNPDLVYHSYEGYSEEEYNSCNFFDDQDMYSSGDGIRDDKTGFFCADVTTKIRVENDNAPDGEMTMFCGSLARIPIPTCNCEIIIGGIKSKGVSKYINHVQFFPLEFESEEFNKLFSVFATDKMEAYKIITPDVIEQLFHLKKNCFGDIDIRIKNNYLYVRFNSGDGFVPNLLNPKKEEESIISSIAVLDEIYRVTHNIKSIIERKVNQ